MQCPQHSIAERTVHYLAVAIHTYLACIALYWLVASIWWCGMHPQRSLRMFCLGLWHAFFVNLWYVAIPMVAVILLDVQVRVRDRRNKSPNQALHGTAGGRADASPSVP